MTKCVDGENFLAGTSYVRVCNQLREDILDQRYQMGDRLKIIQLAERYQVSQMPVREALQQLQGEGLVRIVPNRGAVVRAVDEKFISDVYDIREIVECFFTRRAARLAERADIEELSAIQSSYERYGAPGDIAMRLKLNHDFHGCIYRLAGNEEAMEVMARHEAVLLVLTRRYNHAPSRVVDINAQHNALVAALAAHDVEAAGEVAGRHMREARDWLLSRMRQSAAA